MVTKGTAVIATKEFVLQRFGNEGVKKLTDNLEPETAKLFSSAISANQWYDLKKILVNPSIKITELFYNGNKKTYWEIGKFSAEHGLKSIYKIFVKVGSPKFILNLAGVILPTYYKPSSMKGEILDKNKFKATITEFEEYNEVVEMRIGGWIEKALEISGCQNIKININKSLLKNDECTDYIIEWN